MPQRSLTYVPRAPPSVSHIKCRAVRHSAVVSPFNTMSLVRKLPLFRIGCERRQLAAHHSACRVAAARDEMPEANSTNAASHVLPYMLTHWTDNDPKIAPRSRNELFYSAQCHSRACRVARVFAAPLQKQTRIAWSARMHSLAMSCQRIIRHRPADRGCARIGIGSPSLISARIDCLPDQVALSCASERRLCLLDCVPIETVFLP